MTLTRTRVLTLSVVVVSTSGILYELALATVASYVLGNAVTQFSLTLGIYLSAMGVGTLVSRRLGGVLAARFVEVETCIALVGGSSAGLLFAVFSRATIFRPILYGEVFTIGILVGIELPLLLRLLKEDLGYQESIVQGMTYDYVGGLIASLLFPLVLMPFLGLVRTAALAGMINASVAWMGARLLALGSRRRLLSAAPVAAIGALVALFVYADTLVTLTSD